MADDDLNPFALAPMFAPAGMNEQMAHMIIGAALTTTRAYYKAEIKVDIETQRVFVAITLRRWARMWLFKRVRPAWLRIADRRVKQHLPQGWRLLVYEKARDV